MAAELATVFGMVGKALASLRTLSPALSGDSVTFLDVIVTADEEEFVIEAVGADGESLVQVGRTKVISVDDEPVMGVKKRIRNPATII